jgi:hypothetical protein
MRSPAQIKVFRDAFEQHPKNRADYIVIHARCLGTISKEKHAGRQSRAGPHLTN